MLPVDAPPRRAPAAPAPAWRPPPLPPTASWPRLPVAVPWPDAPAAEAPEPPAEPPPEPRRPRPPRRRRDPLPLATAAPDPPSEAESAPYEASVLPRAAPARLSPSGGADGTAGAGRESPIFGRPSATGLGLGPSEGAGEPSDAEGEESAVRSGTVAFLVAGVSAGPSAVPFAAAGGTGRSGEASPGTRSAGAGRPVIESDIGRIPSRGRARARRAHPAGGWHRAQRRSGAPAWGACIQNEHSSFTVPAVASLAALRGAAAVEHHDENRTDDERGSHERGLRRSRRCHPGETA
jgi:hypothetical protein